MKIKFILIIIISITTVVLAIPENIISVNRGIDNQYIITIHPQMHSDYGFIYPLTFEFTLPDNSTNLKAYKKHLFSQDWTILDTKTKEDFFNGPEVIRFEYNQNKAYVSVGFSSVSDTVFIKIANQTNQSVSITCNNITEYYDNRDAAVSLTLDDMTDWSQAKFEKAIHEFRGYKLWSTCGIITEPDGKINQEAWAYVQRQLDSGYVEAGCHSRTHPGSVPYSDPNSEVSGCQQDVISNLTLPPLYNNGEKEYIYTWIAPNGSTNNEIDEILSENRFLANRMYSAMINYSGWCNWSNTHDIYEHVGITRCIDPPRSVIGWGCGNNDINDLNNAFDTTTGNGNVYHLMCHPNVVEWDEDYTKEHLEHVSNKKNIWYAGLGHIFLYHLGEQNYNIDNTVPIFNSKKVQNFNVEIKNNFINSSVPFVQINLSLTKITPVKIDLFTIQGKHIKTIVNKHLTKGVHNFNWGTNKVGKHLQASNILYVRIKVSKSSVVKKLFIVN